MTRERIDARVERHETPPEHWVRINVAAAAVMLVFALIGVRLWFLQVRRGEDMRSLSEQNRTRVVRVPAGRGVVYDRNGELLVDNRAAFDVVLVPEDAGDRDVTLANLARRLDEPEEALRERLRAPSKRPRYEGIVVDRDVDWQRVVAVETHQMELPGVSLQVVPRRFYPRGSLAAHLLGYVGEASERELAAREGLRPGDLVGKASLERAYDTDLRGVPGGQRVEVNALGRRVRVLEEVPDVPGNSLWLTIDRRLQEVAETALGESDGAIVALDPRNGDVLAIVSRPTFDPNVFARGIRGAEWQVLVQDPKHPLNNRAVQGQYPPGSTFKVAVAAGAMEEGVATPATGATCGGGLQFGNHYFHCWKRGGHGFVDLHWGIAQSCDVWFYQTGQRLGVDGIAKWARKFGLGLPTGIALEHEKGGTIPDTAWKQQRFKQPWYAGETLSVAIGQGYVTVTPLQMANLAATIANGGTRYRPNYVRRIERPDGTVHREVVPEVLDTVGWKPETMRQIHSAMRDVVMNPRGTGKKARVEGFTVAGKTGTAQTVGFKGSKTRGKGGARRTRDHAWFIAFAPVEAPLIAVAAVVEHAGGGGGAIAAPMVQQVIADWLARQGIVGPVPQVAWGEECASTGAC